ncbi:hypothetical protein K437DRAFT_295422 [Tilletiaria anomala UBC 951]|uniref:U6 small nuclear RNA (adenine-(43)-N(6))-methyltransferase n=1 Tax=Tilletiaria anomala (strain ATCC 24038 / CBS 436.72 / UBC 951) TaxID=1037660 RepID=A0A066VUF8_TILAU|nr:uncharacterized protein K437DRAFT_295422 [Tilletiaria anomala UBC 951]KDN42205.1 hypothetical protein K437DRAFT_295422 [Tilletiaria anomala UBC 951]
MHPRSPYARPDFHPNFEELAKKYPELEPLVAKGKARGSAIDYKDPAALRCLTTVLLRHDFSLHVELRSDRLCPPVPNRLNYILWLQDLLKEQQRILGVLRILLSAVDASLSPPSAKANDVAQGAEHTGCRLPACKRLRMEGPAAPAEQTQHTLGLDIGTGASLIYPLLGCASDASWSFVATDTDAVSMSHARATLASADLLTPIRNFPERIVILQREHKDTALIPSADELLAIAPPSDGANEETARRSLGPLASRLGATAASSTSSSRASDRDDVYDFTMCNPPFYGSLAEMRESASFKMAGPSAACTGSEQEMLTPGGEAAFVGKMIEESIKLHRMRQTVVAVETNKSMGAWTCRRTWYTSMLGLRKSVTEVVQKLKVHKIDNYLVTELLQGETKRWVIAWSFTYLRLDPLSLGLSPSSCTAFASILPPFPRRDAIIRWACERRGGSHGMASGTVHDGDSKRIRQLDDILASLYGAVHMRRSVRPAADADQIGPTWHVAEAGSSSSA